MNDNGTDAAYRQACVSEFSHRLIPVALLYLIALLGHFCIQASLSTSMFFNMSQCFGEYNEHFQRGSCKDFNLLLKQEC